MPWTEEQKSLAFATLIPAGVGAIYGISYVTLYQKPDFAYWWQTLRQPDWSLTQGRLGDLVAHSVADLSAMIPLAYATKIVWKEGGGFENKASRYALIAYAVNNGILLLNLPIAYKRNLKCSFFSCAAIAINSWSMAYLYGKVSEKAGYLALPFSLLHTYYCMLLYSMWDLNSLRDDDSE